ncbi:hypothetical protein [Kutzneria kofuensis]|uniref:Uncharacterized protein n=1 Tax=Kutzneria kofuensis TaxID=103725 RepID=A0A7W9NF21_9PSEU|nr:hypothetical protein [Kutzneria kofuensis]MBB5890240.1 hypothetical protein [Kutzneria kofuensis]
MLHPVLLDVLASGDASAERLRPYVDQRGPVVDGVLKLQRMQAKGMLGRSNPVADAVRPAVAKLIGRTPIGVKITNRIAYGRAPVAVRTDLFQ